jgi:hypothetical protein
MSNPPILEIPNTTFGDFLNAQPEPIPPLPQPISHNIITGTDYRTYVLPLFTRWWKFRIAKTTSSYEPEGARLRYPQFCRTFMFRDNDTTLDFIRDSSPWLAEYTDARPMQGVRTS